MKRKAKDLTEKERIVTLDALYTAASSITGRSAVKLFLRDLLTESERIMLGRRIIIARLLIAGETYDSIARRLKVGTDTIGRVHRWLRDSVPGFENAIAAMNKKMNERGKTKRSPFSFTALKRKYPLHFLLFSLADEFSKKKADS